MVVGLATKTLKSVTRGNLSSVREAPDDTEDHPGDAMNAVHASENSLADLSHFLGVHLLNEPEEAVQGSNGDVGPEAPGKPRAVHFAHVKRVARSQIDVQVLCLLDNLLLIQGSCVEVFYHPAARRIGVGERVVSEYHSDSEEKCGAENHTDLRYNLWRASDLFFLLGRIHFCFPRG